MRHLAVTCCATILVGCGKSEVQPPRDTTAMAPATARELSSRLRDQIAPLAGPLLVKPGERYVVAFVGIAPGRYAFYCLPHQALQMKGEVVIR